MIPGESYEVTAVLPRKCPDDGHCHHDCAARREACFRVKAAGPLSGVYPDDRWPAAVIAAEARNEEHDPAMAVMLSARASAAAGNPALTPASNPVEHAFELMLYTLIRIIEVATGEEQPDTVDAHRPWDDLCRDAREAVAGVRGRLDEIAAKTTAAEAILTASAGPGGWKPDWVLLGGPNLSGAGSVFVMHSTELVKAALDRRNLGLETVTTPGGIRLRLPVVETTAIAVVKTFGMIYGESYPAALRSIMADWERRQPRAIEPGSGV